MLTSAVYVGTMTNDRTALLAYCPLEGSGVTLRSVLISAGTVLVGSRTDYWTLTYGTVEERVFTGHGKIILTEGLPTLPKRFPFEPRWSVKRGQFAAVKMTMYGNPVAATDVTMVLEHDTLTGTPR